MEYVVIAILVLLIVAAGVTFFVLNAARRERGTAAADSGEGGTPGSEAAIVAPDDRTPVGDTDQLSDEQAEEGRGGVTGNTRGSVPPAGEGGVGGEGESGAPVKPESERLADRER
jgi:hypothetical protein